MKKIIQIAVSAMVLATVLRGTSLVAGSLNGSAGDMSAYYDGQLFTINLKELPPGGEDANLENNASINLIFMSDDAESAGFPFISVIDAIQGDGFNPLWVEVQIHFAGGVAPQQFVSDEEIADAVEGGLITLEFTDEVYRCSVVGTSL